MEIQKKSSHCTGCSEAFAHEQKHHSLLRIEGNSFLRDDYCEKCWSGRPGLAGMDEIYSHWETKYQDPTVAKATPKEQFIPLLDLCYESIAQGDSDGEAVAYMCALILRRQKVFKFIREEKEEPTRRSVLVFSDKYNDTRIRIVDPQLTESQLEDVRRKLEEKLAHAGGQPNDQ
ncbi:MAG: hypothetical protein JSV16_09240 [Candidatus Hydrogenedentota bacterium]|nr:MAG: hypothetical protein JSV16_09240 [Candidatus Hydrogenedentota bacterium]